GDKSRAGGVDGPIADLVASLNSWPDIFTTSSIIRLCMTGRVSVFAEPTDATRAAGQKGGEWVYVTHGHADAEEIISRVLLCCSNGAPRLAQPGSLKRGAGTEEGAPLVFRFEPFILAAEARTADDAQRLIRCAREAGYRESGVTGDESARVIAGIRCSIRLEVPVTDGGLLLVSPEYLRHLTKLANEKMELNWARIERFHALFKQRFLAEITAQNGSGEKGSWALVVPKQDAKIFKDALKQAGGLNRHRRSLVCDGGVSVALPVTDACAEGLHAFPGKGSKSDKKGQALRMVAAAVAEGQVKVSTDNGVVSSKVLVSCECYPVEWRLRAGLSSERTEDLMAEVPSKWERLGDLVLLPADSFRAPEWAAQGEALWAAVNAALGADRLVRQAPIANTGTRDSQAGLLRGADGWTRHLENGVAFSLDVTRCMFSSGNVTERARMGRLRCASETVVDLFAGIGYYTLPLLVHSRAAKVLACEWNPAAIEALQRNLAFNRCADRCEVLQGNCRQLAPKGVADRVLLGLLPSSREGWPVALAALKPSTGGWLHLHHNVKDSEEAAWIASTQAELETLSRELGRNWRVLIRHVERVKWYAPHMRHLVLDVECRPDQAAVTSAISNGADTDMTTPLTTRLPEVAEYRGMTRERFVEISREKQPAVLKGLDLGIAVDGWTGAYLKSLPSSSTTLVSVHVCPDPTGRLHFVHKNFEFRTMPLAELVGRCESAEEYYLRSIGTNPRKEPSDIAAAFPDLAADLSLPPLFPPDRLFSSVLRISSGMQHCGLRLWTHFDVMDNLLCQVRGTKRVRLWPPPEEAKLYMTGSSSEVTDIDQPDPKKYPLFISAVHFDCMLRPGDVLYIPALWHHNVLAEQDSGMSVSVNVFWRDMERGMYAGKDLYGNRDPPAADAAAAAVEAAAKALAQLPPHYRSFYGQRCVRRLVESLEKGFAE
ncbi:Clavaminate synthase-like protein, partial [Coccomyxa subellipsoidea C-169]